MESLIEVDIETIIQAVEHQKICQQKAEEIIDRFKKKKIKVRSWIFFKKEISLFDFYRKNAGYYGWNYYACLDGEITELESRIIDVWYIYFDFNRSIEHGKRVFLRKSDFDKMTTILETKLDN